MPAGGPPSGSTDPGGSGAEAEAEFKRLGGWPGALGRLFRREDLRAHEAAAVFNEILTGRAEPAQLAAFAAALRTKGESVEEMAGLVGAMLDHSERVTVEGELVDTCGTGGDGSGTINVSTAAALILAGAGARVCKHGGRAASSRAGSADVLETLGVVIDLGPAGVARCIDEVGIGFCFAPRFHPAMRHAASVRKALGVPTVFNFLGPLANPARASRQILGVGDPAMAETMLGVLETKGTRHAMVLFGHDGLDELSTSAPSTIFESHLARDGTRSRRRYEIDARDLGIARPDRSELLGGDAPESAAALRKVLGGETGPRRDLVALNAAAGIVVAGLVAELADAFVLAQATIDSGAALAALEGLVSSSVAAADDGLR